MSSDPAIKSQTQGPVFSFFLFLNQAKTRIFFLLFLRVRRLGCDAVTIACGVVCDGGKLDSEKLFCGVVVNSASRSQGLVVFGCAAGVGYLGLTRKLE
jgi:hypothetical protein